MAQRAKRIPELTLRVHDAAGKHEAAGGPVSWPVLADGDCVEMWGPPDPAAYVDRLKCDVRFGVDVDWLVVIAERMRGQFRLEVCLSGGRYRFDTVGRRVSHIELAAALSSNQVSGARFAGAVWGSLSLPDAVVIALSTTSAARCRELLDSLIVGLDVTAEVFLREGRSAASAIRHEATDGNTLARIVSLRAAVAAAVLERGEWDSLTPESLWEWQRHSSWLSARRARLAVRAGLRADEVTRHLDWRAVTVLAGLATSSLPTPAG